MNKLIVLDKSFLIAKNADEVKNLCLTNDVYMAYDLFMELIYSSEEEKINKRANCFKKFPQKENPVILGATVGELMQHEISHKGKCPSLYDFKKKENFEFNNDLSKPSLNCLQNNSVKGEIQRWLKELNGRTDLYKKSSAEVYKWFPALRGHKSGQSEEEINKAREKVINDNRFVLDCYDQIKPKDYPSGSILDEKWFLFIQMKTRLIYAINYIKKYGAGNILNSKWHPHDVLDMEYCMLGIFGDGVATRDNEIKDCFKLLCPSGTLIS